MKLIIKQCKQRLSSICSDYIRNHFFWWSTNLWSKWAELHLFFLCLLLLFKTRVPERFNMNAVNIFSLIGLIWNNLKISHILWIIAFCFRLLVSLAFHEIAVITFLLFDALILVIGFVYSLLLAILWCSLVSTRWFLYDLLYKNVFILIDCTNITLMTCFFT